MSGVLAAAFESTSFSKENGKVGSSVGPPGNAAWGSIPVSPADVSAELERNWRKGNRIERRRLPQCVVAD